MGWKKGKKRTRAPAAAQEQRPMDFLLDLLSQAVKTNPKAVLDILQMILDFLKAHPELLEKLIDRFAPKDKA